MEKQTRERKTLRKGSASTGEEITRRDSEMHTQEDKNRKPTESDGLLGRGSETRKMGLAVKMSVCLLATLCIIIGTGGIALGVAGYPLHASCRVEWTFGLPCESVHAALKNQIEAWKTAETCGTGQKCLYKHLFSNSTTLTGTHETPVKHYIDDISYTFSPGSDGTCNVVGFSSSQLWYAVLDYGTNYCNIHNLVEGANLHVNDPKYSESTRNAVCTQYTSADCEKY